MRDVTSKGVALWRGVRDVCRAAFFADREKGYYHLPLGPAAIFVILLLIGLARNFLEVVLLSSMPEPVRWYSFSPNKQFVVSLWPFHFCFLSAGVTFVWGLMLGRTLDRRKLVAMFFYLQTLNLVAPFFDWLGNVFLRLPYHFMAPADAVTDWFAYTSKMFVGDFATLGLLIVLVCRFLVRDFGLTGRQSAFLLFAMLNLLYWPTVHCFSTFNMIFKYCTGWWDAHWIGYGLYSLFAGLFGCVLLNIDRLLPRRTGGVQG